MSTKPIHTPEASHATTEAPASSSRAARKNPLRMVLSYEWVVNNLYYILFLAILTVGYIFNGHQADRTIRRINRAATEIRQLEYEYKTLKSELMYKSREAELLRATEPMGLTLTRTPHQRIPAANTPQAQVRNQKTKS